MSDQCTLCVDWTQAATSAAVASAWPGVHWHAQSVHACMQAALCTARAWKIICHAWECTGMHRLCSVAGTSKLWSASFSIMLLKSWIPLEPAVATPHHCSLSANSSLRNLWYFFNTPSAEQSAAAALHAIAQNSTAAPAYVSVDVAELRRWLIEKLVVSLVGCSFGNIAATLSHLKAGGGPHAVFGTEEVQQFVSTMWDRMRCPATVWSQHAHSIRRDAIV